MVRHGETLWNIEHKTQGQLNIPLTDKGIRQARAVGQALKELNISRIFCSDLMRAAKTAEIIAQEIGACVEIMPGLREMDLGCWEGLTAQEISRRYEHDYKLWRTDPSKAVIYGAETLDAFKERISNCIKAILSQYFGNNILVVSHALALKILVLELLNMDIKYFNSIRMDNASITAVDIREKGNVLVLLNDVCHLRRL